MSLREDLIKLSELKETRKWYSEELKKDVYITKLNTKDGTELGKLMQSDPNIFSKLILKSLCDEKGELIFAKNDMPYVNKLPLSFTSELAQEILIFNKMVKGAVEKEVKN